MNSFFFLKESQIIGNDRLKILKKCGYKSAVTDFSILLGVNNSYQDYIREDNSHLYRVGRWWTSSENHGKVSTIYTEEEGKLTECFIRKVGARPAITYSSIIPYIKNENINSYGVKEVEYGVYPQWVEEEETSLKIEKEYNKGTLRPTGKYYTTDLVTNWECSASFIAKKHAEYEYNGNNYIRVTEDENNVTEVLTDHRFVKEGKSYWIRVEPLVWLVDEEADIALSKRIIFSGIQFNKSYPYDGNFENTSIKQYMDEFLSKDIIPFNKSKSENIQQKIMLKDLLNERKQQLEKLRKSSMADNNKEQEMHEEKSKKFK